MWYRLAAISGNVWGDSNADRLANDATEGESTQMQKLLRNWQPGQCEAEILMGKNSD
jgi:hypothetical protein